VETLAKSLFTDFVWAFEMTAVLLVIAVVGSVVLARRSGHRPEVPPSDADRVPEATEVPRDREGANA
jgi:NADH-quinone oxidoreductase subunit J